MPQEQKIPRTVFGEEIPPIKLFSFDITSRCNMDCNFCFQKGREYNIGKDMTFEEFKTIVDQIADLPNSGVKKYVCLAGGEPLLNKDVERMSNYAVRKLGEHSVSITTNLALFPTNVSDAVALIQRLGSPIINVSIDREHLRYGKEMEARIKAFFAAVKQLDVRARVQNVAQTKYQEKYRWPKNIARLIPKEFKEKVSTNDSYGRREFYSHKKAVEEVRNYLGKLKAGEQVLRPPIGIMMGLGVAPPSVRGMPVSVNFTVNGKAYLFSGLTPFHAPQFAIGNWRKESLSELTQKNLPYKINIVRHWFGMNRIESSQKLARFNSIESSNPAKARLFGNYVSRRLEAQKKVVRSRSKR